MMKPLVPLVVIGILLAIASQWGLTSEGVSTPEVSVEETQPFKYNSHAKRNPFLPLILPSEEDTTPTPTPVRVTQADFTPSPTPVVFPSLQIDVILWFPESERESLVVIDNALLGVGDMVDECEIVDITSDSIRVRYMGQERVMRATAPDPKVRTSRTRRRK